MTGIHGRQSTQVEPGMVIRARFLRDEPWRRVRGVTSTGAAVRITYDQGPSDVASVGVRYEQQVDEGSGPDSPARTIGGAPS